MLAKDIMTKKLITVSPNTSVKEAAKLLRNHRISGLPVVNDQGKLEGIVTEGDFLGKHKDISSPGYLEFLGGVLPLQSADEFLKEAKKYMAAEVSELMTENVITASPDTDTRELTNLMISKHIKRLPIVENGMLVGIVSRADLLERTDAWE